MSNDANRLNTQMGSPHVYDSDALVNALVMTTERNVEVRALEATEHEHHIEYAESTQLIDKERQIERTDSSHSDDQSDTDHSVSINCTSPNQNQYQQNPESVIKVAESTSQQGTAGNLNSTSNTIEKTKASHKRQRLVMSSCHW